MTSASWSSMIKGTKEERKDRNRNKTFALISFFLSKKTAKNRKIADSMPGESMCEDLFTRNVFVKRNEQSISDLTEMERHLPDASCRCTLARMHPHDERLPEMSESD